MIRNRLLLAIDQFEAGDAAVDFTIGHATQSGADVVVLHVRELPPTLRVPPLESAGAARDLVALTVLRMRDAGVAAAGWSSRPGRTPWPGGSSRSPSTSSAPGS